MAKKNEAMFTQAQVQAMIDRAVAQALAQKPTKSAKGKGTAKLVEFKKADGTTVQCTEAQAKAWEAWRDGSADRKANREANLQAWATKRDGYKPTKALKDAIKANRARITLAVAKAQYGFVGTKNDLKVLKDSICK